MDKLQKLIDLCACGVTVEVNYHRTLYQPIEEYVDNWTDCPSYGEGVREEIIRRNSMVTICFYPHTPIGSIDIADYSLDRALDRALACFEKGLGNVS